MYFPVLCVLPFVKCGAFVLRSLPVLFALLNDSLYYVFFLMYYVIFCVVCFAFCSVQSPVMCVLQPTLAPTDWGLHANPMHGRDQPCDNVILSYFGTGAAIQALLDATGEVSPVYIERSCSSLC